MASSMVDSLSNSSAVFKLTFARRHRTARRNQRIHILQRDELPIREQSDAGAHHDELLGQFHGLW